MALFVIRTLAEKRPGARFRLRSWETRPTSAGVTYTGIDQALTSDRPKYVRAISYVLSLRREVRFCTEAVFPGGTVFHGRSRSNWSLLLAFTLATLCRIYNRPLAAIGVGVSEMTGWRSRLMMRFILNTCWLFAVRDRKSLDRCLELVPDAHVVASSDIVFAAPKLLGAAQSVATHTRTTVGIALSAAHHELIISMRMQLKDALTSLESSLDSGRLEHLLLSDPPGSACGVSDRFVHESVFGPVPALTLTTASALDPFACLSLVVGSRYHALVLAASTETPFVGIGGDDKIVEICREFGMPRLEYSEVTPAALQDAADRAIATGLRSEDVATARRSAQEVLARLAEGPW